MIIFYLRMKITKTYPLLNISFLITILILTVAYSNIYGQNTNNVNSVITNDSRNLGSMNKDIKFVSNIIQMIAHLDNKLNQTADHSSFERANMEYVLKELYPGFKSYVLHNTSIAAKVNLSSLVDELSNTPNYSNKENPNIALYTLKNLYNSSIIDFDKQYPNFNYRVIADIMHIISHVYDRSHDNSTVKDDVELNIVPKYASMVHKLFNETSIAIIKNNSDAEEGEYNLYGLVKGLEKKIDNNIIQVLISNIDHEISEITHIHKNEFIMDDLFTMKRFHPEMFGSN
jgi:hypothetical protein